MTGPSSLPRTWRKPPFIANPLLRWGLIAATLIYLVWVAYTLPFNWERIGQGMTRAARIFSGAIPPSFTRHELLIDGFLESMQIAILSTLMGLAIRVPIAFMEARNLAAKPIYCFGRNLIILEHTVQPVT